MKIYVVKQLSGSLKPADNSDYDELKKLKVGEIYACEIKRERNIGHHRKFFALIKLVFDNQQHYISQDALRTDLTIASGYYTTRYNLDGKEIIEAKSISFAKMNQSEFEEFYNRVLDTIVRYFHFDREDIKNNVEQYF